MIKVKLTKDYRRYGIAGEIVELSEQAALQLCRKGIAVPYLAGKAPVETAMIEPKVEHRADLD